MGKEADAKANDERARRMKEQLEAAGVSTVSELSPHFGKPITYDGVDGKVSYAVGDRFAADLADGRRVWGLIAALVPNADGSLTFNNPEGVA